MKMLDLSNEASPIGRKSKERRLVLNEVMIETNTLMKSNRINRMKQERATTRNKVPDGSVLLTPPNEYLLVRGRKQ